MSRRMDERETRRWVGDNAAGEDIDRDGRRWVVWGSGAVDAGPFGYEHGDVIAEGIARAHDPGWGERVGGWAVIVDADEADVDAFVDESVTADGYAAYLAPGKTEEVAEELMRGTLRSDVGPRRKVDQPRPSQ